MVWQGSPSWKALLLFYIKWTLVSLLPVAAWIVLDRLMDDPPSVTWFVAATVAGLALTYVVGWIKRATTRYRVTDRRIQIRTGLVSRNESSANLSRVQNVNVAQSGVPAHAGHRRRRLGHRRLRRGRGRLHLPRVEDPSRLVHLVDSSLERVDDPSGRSPLGL